MESFSLLLVIGSAVLFALFSGKALDKLKAPMVVGYVLIGVIMGGSFLNIFTHKILYRVEFINDLALGIIAFLIGAELKFSKLKSLGKTSGKLLSFHSFKIALTIFILV